MKFGADSLYLIGKDHTSMGCQDYTLHSEPGEHERACGSQPLVIVCDGCTSAADVDVGARMIAHSAVDEFTMLGAYAPDEQPLNQRLLMDIGRRIIHRARVSVMNIGLSEDSLLSTLLVATVRGDDAEIVFFGDGVGFFVYEDSMEIVEISYSNNAPYYLFYQLADSFDDKYLEMFKGEYTRKRSVFHRMQTGKFVREAEQTDYGVVPVLFESRRIDPESGLEFFGVMSDGVGQFFSKTASGAVPSLDVIVELLKIDSFSGEFIKRQLLAATRDYAKQLVHHGDDVSMAAISVWR